MTRTLPAALLALLAAALLSGCAGSSESDSSGSASPQAVVSEGADSAVVLAAARTSDAGSARMAMTITMTMAGVPGLDGPVELGAAGEFDFAGQRGQMRLDYSGLLAALGAQAEQAKGFMPDEMRMDGKVMYMRMPALETVRPGKSWLKLDVAALAAQQGVDQSLIGSQFGQNDPSQFLQYLEGASTRVQEIGREQVRGVETTRYHAAVDLTKAPDYLPDEQRARYEQAIAQLTKQTGLDEVPVDAWIDDEGLLRRMTMNMSFAAAGAGDASMLMTMELFDFGVDVQVEAPPESKVLDFSELGALGSS